MVDSLIQTTDDVAPGERWSFWKDTVMPNVDGQRLAADAPFRAARSVTATSTGLFMDTSSDPVTLQRHARTIARDGIDHAAIVLFLHGRGTVGPSDRAETRAAPGDVRLLDLGRPYAAAVLDPYRELRIYVPRAAFAARVGRIETLSGLVIPGDRGLGGLFAAHLAAYAGALPSLSRQEADIGMEGVLHLLSGAVRSRVASDGEGGAPLAGDALLALATRHIEAALGDPNLDVASLARAIGVSRTQLYRAYADRGGIATGIRDARLDRARFRLADAADSHRSLEDIARLCGFVDYSTFVRAFRRRFGVPPRDCRGR